MTTLDGRGDQTDVDTGLYPGSIAAGKYKIEYELDPGRRRRRA